MKDYLGRFTLKCPNRMKCPHASFMHDVTEGSKRPVCSAQGCPCGGGQIESDDLPSPNNPAVPPSREVIHAEIDARVAPGYAPEIKRIYELLNPGDPS